MNEETPNTVSEPTPQPASTPPSSQKTNGLAIAALVIGILAFIGGFLPFWGFLLGATAVVLGIIALKKPGLKGLSITGIVTGGLAVLWNLIVTIIFVVALATGAAVVGGVGNALQEQQSQDQAVLNSKKDFAKGETANFADTLEVTVNSVETGYVPEESFYAPEDGKQYVVVNLTVKNISDEGEYVSSSSFDINEAGVAVSSSFVTVSPEFDYGTLDPDATMTGNVVYEVSSDATDLKLQYSTTVFDESYELKEVTYTLAI